MNILNSPNIEADMSHVKPYGRILLHIVLYTTNTIYTTNAYCIYISYKAWL